MSTLFTHIRTLVFAEQQPKMLYAGAEMAQLPCIDNAWLRIDSEGRIADFGAMETCPEGLPDEENINAKGRLIWPSWCDSHTHAVFAAPRQGEYRMRLQGKTYAEIAASGGGILNSAAKLAALSEDDLFEISIPRVMELVAQGTGAIEIKSGYGLNTEAEMKMLRVARRLGEQLPVTVRTTFLGAHALPMAYKGRASEYVDLVINEMLPAVAAELLADYIDVFCEEGYFSVADMVRIIEAGAYYEIPAKVHVNQFTSLGAIDAAVSLGALSVDHLEVMTEADFAALHKGNTLPVALPGCSLFLGIPYTPGRRIIDEGLPLVLASDFNPGSTPSGNMSMVVALACSQMRLLPEEAIVAATLNGAAAMGLAADYGSIARGKMANLWLSKPMEDITALPYAFGTSFVDRVMWHGAWVEYV